MKTRQEAEEFIQEHYLKDASPELEQARIVYEESRKDFDKAYQELKQAIEECIV